MTSTSLTIKFLQPAQIKSAKVLAGISPKIMGRVFAAWMAFCSMVMLIILLAPHLSQTFVLTTTGALVVFTFALFAQSRISEGWPSVMYLNGCLAVVRDPHKREFMLIPRDFVADVEPAVIKPNQKAVSVMLHVDRLSRNDIQMLNRAVWPREDRVLAPVYFKTSAQICSEIKDYLSATAVDAVTT